jgi:hypothetical protein
VPPPPPSAVRRSVQTCRHHPHAVRAGVVHDRVAAFAGEAHLE